MKNDWNHGRESFGRNRKMKGSIGVRKNQPKLWGGAEVAEGKPRRKKDRLAAKKNSVSDVVGNGRKKGLPSYWMGKRIRGDNASLKKKKKEGDLKSKRIYLLDFTKSS